MTTRSSAGSAARPLEPAVIGTDSAFGTSRLRALSNTPGGDAVQAPEPLFRGPEHRAGHQSYQGNAPGHVLRAYLEGD